MRSHGNWTSRPTWPPQQGMALPMSRQLPAQSVPSTAHHSATRAPTLPLVYQQKHLCSESPRADSRPPDCMHLDYSHSPKLAGPVKSELKLHEPFGARCPGRTLRTQPETWRPRVLPLWANAKESSTAHTTDRTSWVRSCGWVTGNR